MFPIQGLDISDLPRPSMSPNGVLRPVTLRRSCQACARGKRRCDQRSPQCSRCQAKGIDCEYKNPPLAGSPYNVHSFRAKANIRSAPAETTPIQKSLRLEIIKNFQQPVIDFLVNKMRGFPATFAHDRKTLFIHPDGYQSSMPASLQETFHLCNIYIQHNHKTGPGDPVYQIRQRSAKYYSKFYHASTFDELLGFAQSLLLIHCELLLQGDDLAPWSEKVSDALEDIAFRLWQQAPIQLSSTMSPRRAWLFGESVRRTIILTLVLRSAYSLKKRNYSTRTPFIEALPFDLRMHLWDDDDNDGKAWGSELSYTADDMMSLCEYSGALESGRFRQPSQFGALILAACKGKQASVVSSPTQQY